MTCLQCHYTCFQCSDGTDISCSSCHSSWNRDKSILNECLCVSHYVDVGVEECSLCSSVINECDECSSPTQCDLCLYDMIFNSTSIKCECPFGKYYISDISICVDFAGCMHASIFSNIIIC